MGHESFKKCVRKPHQWKVTTDVIIFTYVLQGAGTLNLDHAALTILLGKRKPTGIGFPMTMTTSSFS